MRVPYVQQHYYLIRRQTANTTPLWPTKAKLLSSTCRFKVCCTWSSDECCNKKKDKVLVILGATGCGKSNLALKVATRLELDAQIINSDKMQVYNGLDITTNKIPMQDRGAIPHHLIGDVDPLRNPDFTAADFRLAAGSLISGMSANGTLPIIAGGSNSFVHALLVDEFDKKLDEVESGPVPLRYDCCFLWVDVAFPVLREYLSERVDEMMNAGMLEELERFFAKLSSDPDYNLQRGMGLMKAIGVPELEDYFTKCHEKRTLEEAVGLIKENTWQLGRRQIGKIVRLRDIAGWQLHRVDATSAVAMKMRKDKNWESAWERGIVEPTMEIVRRFVGDASF